jgi:hypothetical protein
VFAPKRAAAAADEILKSQEHSAYRKNDGEMTAAECTQTLALNSEVAGAITKSDPKNGKRNGNKNEHLLCKRDDKFNPRRQRFQRNLSSEKTSGAGRAEAVGFDERPLTVAPTSFSSAQYRLKQLSLDWVHRFNRTRHGVSLWAGAGADLT